MPFAKHNPKIPEGINASRDNPLKEFFLMLVGAVAGIVLVVAVLVLSAHTMAKFVPFRYEQKIADWFSIGDGTPADLAPTELEAFARAEQALQELADKLAVAAELPADMPLRLHLLAMPEVPNAFATLGGHIFVTTGLLKQVHSENALAMVIAHEMAHIRLRHPAKSMSGGVVTQLFLALVLGSDGGSLLQNGLAQSGAVTLLSFSRGMEEAADAAALKTLSRYYGHVAGADEFFGEMAAQSRVPRWQAVFATHPDVEARLTAIRAEISRSSEVALLPLDARFRLPGLLSES